jgi:hypothetical protein
MNIKNIGQVWHVVRFWNMKAMPLTARNQLWIPLLQNQFFAWLHTVFICVFHFKFLWLDLFLDCVHFFFIISPLSNHSIALNYGFWVLTAVLKSISCHTAMSSVDNVEWYRPFWPSKLQISVWFVLWSVTDLLWWNMGSSIYLLIGTILIIFVEPAACSLAIWQFVTFLFVTNLFHC